MCDTNLTRENFPFQDLFLHEIKISESENLGKEFKHT